MAVYYYPSPEDSRATQQALMACTHDNTTNTSHELDLLRTVEGAGANLK